VYFCQPSYQSKQDVRCSRGTRELRFYLNVTELSNLVQPPPQGRPPPPPKIPHELLYNGAEQEDAMSISSPVPAPQLLPHIDSPNQPIHEQMDRDFISNQKRPRTRSPSSHSEDYGMEDEHSPSYRTSPSSYLPSLRSSYVAPPGPSKKLRTGAKGMPDLTLWSNSETVPQRQLVSSPEPGASHNEIFEALMQYAKSMIEPDPGWKRFFVLKGGLQHVSSIVEQYRFVQRKLDELEGRKPFRSTSHKVSKVCLNITFKSLHLPITLSRLQTHVLSSLYMSDEWGSDCTETLMLLDLYGPKGKRCEDTRIIQMINDQSEPRGNLAKRFLKNLREVDKEWLKAHPQESLKQGPYRYYDPRGRTTDGYSTDSSRMR
jgi:hypothetical protein